MEKERNERIEKGMVAFRRLANITGAGVILVHNAGKQKKDNKASY